MFVVAKWKSRFLAGILALGALTDGWIKRVSEYERFTCAPEKFMHAHVFTDFAAGNESLFHHAASS